MATYTATIATGETVTRTTTAAWTHIVEFTKTVAGARNDHRNAIDAMAKSSRKRGANREGITKLMANEVAALEALDSRNDDEVMSVSVYQWCKSATAAQKMVDNINGQGHRARAIALNIN